MRFLFLIIFFPFAVLAEDAVALGVKGFTCDLWFTCDLVLQADTERQGKNYSLGWQPDVPEKIDVSFSSGLPSYSGKPEVHTVKSAGSNFLPGQRIFVFSAKDPVSLEKAKTVIADLGLCIEYDSLSSVAEFRAQTGIKFPVQLATADIVQFLGLTAYPALVTIKGDEIEIKQGL